jgi:hypothetical protein
VQLEPVFDDAIALESELLDPKVRSDQHAVERLLAPDFTEIGRSGRIASRDEVLSSIGGFASSWGAPAVASEMVGRMLADGLVLLTYVTVSDVGRARRSSIWRQVGDTWQVVFHQGTPLTDA